MAMRRTSHMGRALGAVEIEDRVNRASPRYVSRIVVGTVERFSPGQQALGAPGSRFTPTREIAARSAVKALEAALSQAGEVYRADGAEAGMAAIDRAVETAMQQSK
jgi:hypothetical protein